MAFTIEEAAGPPGKITNLGRAARAFNEAARRAEGLREDPRPDVADAGAAICKGLVAFADAVIAVAGDTALRAFAAATRETQDPITAPPEAGRRRRFPEETP